MTDFDDRLAMAEAHLEMHGDASDAAAANTIDELPPAAGEEPADFERLLTALLEREGAR